MQKPPDNFFRLYDPQEGKIYLDGTCLEQLSPTWLRSHIGAVNQVCKNFQMRMSIWFT